MRKFRSVLAAVLGLSVLVAFTGCGLITDEAKKEEVFAALEQAEISAFDLTAELSSKSETKSDDGSGSYTVSQTVNASVYEQNELLYGDLYTNISSKTVQETKSEKTTETSDKYGIPFARGKDVYSANGKWSDTRARAGDFDTLMDEYLESGKELTWANSSQASFDVEEYAAYFSFSKLEGKSVYQDGDGYRVEIDVVKAASAVFDSLSAAADYYTNHPDCTVAELFKAAGIAGVEEILLGDGSGTKRADKVFATPSGFSARLARAQDSPEIFLLETLFGFRSAEGNQGSLNFTVTAKLNGEMALTEMRVAMSAQTKETTDDGDGSTTNSVTENFTLTVPETTPVLRDLTGLRADLGYRFTPAVYTVPQTADSLIIKYPDSGYYGSVYGNYSGTMTLTETQLLVEFKFEETEGSRVLTDTRRYDLNYDAFDWDDLFERQTFPDGEQVYNGSYFYVSYSLSRGVLYITCADLDIQVSAEKAVVTL